MPLVQKLICKYCSHKFHVYFESEEVSIIKAYQVICPECNKSILFVDGFGKVIEKIPQDGVVASMFK